MRASEGNEKIGSKEEMNYIDVYDNLLCFFHRYMMLIYIVFQMRFSLQVSIPADYFRCIGFRQLSFYDCW